MVSWVFKQRVYVLVSVRFGGLSTAGCVWFVLVLHVSMRRSFDGAQGHDVSACAEAHGVAN